jgi:hypothetical protein
MPHAPQSGTLALRGRCVEEEDAYEDELDAASNAVVQLVRTARLDEAEAAARDLLVRFPDVHDGWDRLGVEWCTRRAATADGPLFFVYRRSGQSVMRRSSARNVPFPIVDSELPKRGGSIRELQMKGFIGLLVLASVIAAPAFAADMPVPALPNKAALPPPPPLVFSWIDWYMGNNAGYGWVPALMRI